MKVRLNFVRALLNDPKVIFLDEPTNGLDPANARVIKDIILELKSLGKTIFISTHLMGDVEQLCDEVAFINEGRVLEISTPKALKLKYGKPQVKIEYLTDNNAKEAFFPLDNLGNNPQFLETIKKHSIVTVHSDEMSMEQIFIDVIKERRP